MSRLPADVKILLDFIGNIEAPKGYDTIFGNRHNRLKKPVTKMTIAEVQANQANWGNGTWVRKNWGQSTFSSATGRYQFMRSTLRDLIKELNLNVNAKFDKDMQDDLGWYLLRKRGLDAWRFGRIDDIEFAKRLAQEWASMPVIKGTRGAHRNVTRGQSYYAGDGLNKSLVSPSAVEGLLAKAKAAYSTKGEPQKPAKPSPVPPAAIGVGAGGAGAVVAVEQAPDGTLETIVDNIGMFGMTGSQTLAVIGSLVMVAVVGIMVYRVWKRRNDE